MPLFTHLCRITYFGGDVIVIYRGKIHKTVRFTPEDMLKLEEMLEGMQNYIEQTDSSEPVNMSTVIRFCIRYTYKDLEEINNRLGMNVF